MLQRPPTEQDLSRAYYELAKIDAQSAGEYFEWPYPEMEKEKLLTIAAEMSRYDPRLFGILVAYFVHHWTEINPTQLRIQYAPMTTPEIFGVISEFMKSAAAEREVVHFSNYLAQDLKPVPTQFFFYHLYEPGGPLAWRATEASLAEFKRWGFLAAEKPTVDTATKKNIGTFDRGSRLNILRSLLNKNKTIAISDYLKAMGVSISRQQALIDLKNCKWVRKLGRGRRSRWKLASHRRMI